MNKAFTNNSHVVAIKSTGNVFSYEAVLELNIKPKNYIDLITGEPFDGKNDIITLQNPKDDDHMALRDISNFVHIQQIRDITVKEKQSETKIRYNPTAEKVIKEIENTKKLAAEQGTSSKTLEDYAQELKNVDVSVGDVEEILAMKPTAEDVIPGLVNTDGKASSSFTSTAMTSWTSNATRLATADEIREAKWTRMKALGKKGYVQLQTSLGNLNIEIHCDLAPRTSWNFITLCQRGYYDNTIFHRLVTDFMVQGGDPSGTGSGGESAFGSPFRDEIDTRLLHADRGIISMANSGTNTNSSQFFITFKEAKHLDFKHSVFGRLVGGADVLDRIEAVGNDKREKPLSEIKLLKAFVFTNPIGEAERNLKEFVEENMKLRRLARESRGLPQSLSSSATSATASGAKRAREEEVEAVAQSGKVGKYLTTASAAPAKASQNDKIAAFLKSQQSNFSMW